jgi:hypothetical protein
MIKKGNLKLIIKRRDSQERMEIEEFLKELRQAKKATET